MSKAAAPSARDIGDRLYYRALKQHPRGLLEIRHKKAFLVMTGVLAFFYQIVFWYLGMNRNLWLFGYAAVAVIAASIFDTYSTVITINEQAKLRERGIDPGIIETNPDIPDDPTPRQVIFSFSKVVNLLVILASYFLPWMGLLIGAGHFLAGMGNMGIVKPVEVDAGVCGQG